MGTSRETMFDNIVFTAAQLLRAPLTVLMLVGEDCTWVKAYAGPVERNRDRAALFCRTVVETGDVLMVENAETDPRFAASFRTAPEPGTRFCAAVPIIGPHGYRIGALCALDSQVRPIPKRHLVHLQQLAEQAGELLQLRVPGLGVGSRSQAG